MHMNSVPQHLSSEDRTEYERVLDAALRSARPEIAAAEGRLNTEQLRTLALNAGALITDAAADEYDAYVKIREEAHEAASGPTGSGSSGTGSASGPRTAGLADTMGEVPEPAGAGVLAVVAALAPVLAGAAAVIFLLVGYVLRAVSPDLAIGRTLLTTGWVFGAITAAAILAAAAGLLIAALRNNATALRAGPRGELDQQVELARAAWREALLARGITPFLQEALANAPATGAITGVDGDPAGTGGGRRSEATTGRMPSLGYHRPGFSSPDGGPAAGPRPSYSSPDFSSPDFGGPEHKLE
ncbi:hypothetical protein [Streptomyces uncialis]|uniref:Membrane protein n=1 Tax=Streptomyces uncialis TaxID=1048205 RepID=A0A1Q4VB31_9ACTN|nr:hypothetical protein [Streptomyces uncialis]OKH95036.1 membrane protein [Streptomyces uncialis]